MAPPCFGDLGKQARDLHSKGYHPGTFQFEATTKTQSGIKFTTNGQKDLESGKMTAGSEVTFAWPDYGMTYVEKWNTSNDLVVDMSIEDKLVKGGKFSFVSSFNPTTSKKKGTVESSYKNDYVNGTADVDFDYAGPTVNSSLVCGYKGWLAGYQMGYSTSKKSLTTNNFSLGYDAGDKVVHTTVKNSQDFGGSYYHRFSPKFEAGIGAEWSSANRSTQGGVALKYAASDDTSMKAKAYMNGSLGLSVQQKVCDSTSLTLSALVDAKNLAAGGHRVGLSLEFEQ